MKNSTLHKEDNEACLRMLQAKSSWKKARMCY